MKILAIESSCDETSASVCIDGIIKSNVIFSQTEHEKFGGVIPELASRIHIQSIIPVVKKSLEKSQTALQEIDVFAFAQAPGLIGSLLVGACFTKSLSLIYKKPLIAVNHIEAHISSIFIENKSIAFPFLCLSVSGGHTQIFLCKSHTLFECIGESLDDAAGEAFDKSAKLMGLDYPGGKWIDALAQNGFPEFEFAKTKVPNYDYSFSGLKTSILYFLQRQEKSNPDFIKNNLNNLCASIQKSIVDILLNKFFMAAKELGINTLSITGGVSANSLLRKTFSDFCIKHKYQFNIPAFEYCTDNAAMIAMNAHYKCLKKDFAALDADVFAKN